MSKMAITCRFVASLIIYRSFTVRYTAHLFKITDDCMCHLLNLQNDRVKKESQNKPTKRRDSAPIWLVTVVLTVANDPATPCLYEQREG
jgi:hypothetical protein